MSGGHEANTVQRRTLLAALFPTSPSSWGLGVGGVSAGSSALLANTIDNGSDAAVYLIGFLACDRHEPSSPPFAPKRRFEILHDA